MRRFFFFHAEDGIRVATVTGVQTCALPIWICGARLCRAVTEPGQARAFSSLLWGQSRIPRAPTPPVGSPVFQLRFEEGPPAALINATAIRVHGLNCGRFQRGKWYR